MDYYIYSDELYHHGVTGMKWGIRRYQNKDGSLTKLGRKKLFQNKGDDNEPSAVKPKTHKEMSDDELRKATDRYNLEANYLNARSRANPSNPQKSESFGKKFLKEAIQPALINSGRTQIEKYLNTEVSKLLGSDKADEMATLRKEAEKLGLQSKISTSKKILESNNKWFEEQRKNNS